MGVPYKQNGICFSPVNPSYLDFIIRPKDLEGKKESIVHSYNKAPLMYKKKINRKSQDKAEMDAYLSGEETRRRERSWQVGTDKISPWDEARLKLDSDLNHDVFKTVNRCHQ